MSDERSRDWCFAIENYTSDDIFQCQKMIEDCQYAIVARKLKYDGTAYLHGTVYFKIQKSQERMRKYVRNAAFAKRSSVAPTISLASQICKDNAISFDEFGSLPHQGKKAAEPITDHPSATNTANDYFALANAPQDNLSAEGFHCENCSAYYKSRTGLWKHRKMCGQETEGAGSSTALTTTVSTALTTVNPIEPIATTCTITTDRDLVMMLIRENSELKNLMIEQQGKMMEHQQNLVMEIVRNNNNINNNNSSIVPCNNNNQNSVVPSSNNNTGNGNNGNHNTQNNLQNNCNNNITNKNSHNNTFNLNFFLNETCKNAMNMSEFVDSINLELADLMRVGEMGYVDGISDIILKNLRALDITNRPIHCTDKKRETFYVKDDNKWEKESPENQKIKQAITRVANKNYRLVDEYKRNHPDCNRSNSVFCDQYNKIIVEATGGDLDVPRDVKDKRIIHKISKEVGIHDEKSL